jgi:hypothetical protein
MNNQQEIETESGSESLRMVIRYTRVDLLTDTEIDNIALSSSKSL